MKRNRSNSPTPPLKLAQDSGANIPWTQVEFGSSLEKAREVEDKLLSDCEKHRYGEADLFAIKLALEEALVNAVKHGNTMDPKKMVKVQYHVSAQRADVTIEDEGEGFNPSELPDPTMDENLEMCSGRGILLMRAYMSSVVFNPRGNKVTLTKFNEEYKAGGGRTGTEGGTR